MDQDPVYINQKAPELCYCYFTTVTIVDTKLFLYVIIRQARDW